MNAAGWSDGACVRLVQALGHFLWEGAVIWAVAAGAAGLLRRASAQVRYSVLVGALLAMAACPVVTFALLPAGEQATAEPAIAERPSAVVAEPLAPRGAAAPARAGGAPRAGGVGSDAPTAGLPAADGEPHGEPPAAVKRASRDGWQTAAPWLALGYLAGVAVMLGRLVLGLQGGRRLRRCSQPAADPALLAAAARQARRLGLAVVPAVALCRRLAGPLVIGVLRPSILLPASLASGLTAAQAEAILAHELAHIRRCDCLVNLLQRLVEAALFFHPAVWLLSRRIRLERESCCDDMVVAAGAAPAAYAESLVRVAELSLAGRRDRVAASPAVAAAERPSLLGERILRLLGARGREGFRLGPGGMAAVVLAVSAAATVCFLSPGTAQEPASRPEAAGGLDIRLVGVQPDGSDDIVDAQGKKVGEMFSLAGMRWNKDTMCRAFIFELPKTEDRFLPEQFFGLRTTREGQGLSTSQGAWCVEHDRRRLLVCVAVFDRIRKEKGILFTRKRPIDKVDVTLRYYLGPPRDNVCSFTGPFARGQTRQADGGKPYTLRFKRDWSSSHPSASFHLSTKQPFIDQRPLVYDTAGRRHLLFRRSGRGGSRGAEWDYMVHDVPLRRIARIVFGEKPHEKTFTGIPVVFPNRPVRDHPEYLDEMAKALGLSAEEIRRKTNWKPQEAAKVMHLARGQHVYHVHNGLLGLRFDALRARQQEQLLRSAAIWAKAPYVRWRAMGVKLGMRWTGGGEFVAGALELLDAEDTDTRRQMASCLRRCPQLSQRQIDHIKQRVLNADDPIVSGGLIDCLTRGDTPAGEDVLWELALAPDERPWLWWPALERLAARGQIKGRASLPDETRLRLILICGAEKGEEHLAPAAHRLLPAMLHPKHQRIVLSSFSFHNVFRLLVEHVDRAEATEAMIRFLRGTDDEWLARWAVDRVVKQLNAWYGLKLGGLGRDTSRELENLYGLDWHAIIAETLKWYESRQPASQPAATRPSASPARAAVSAELPKASRLVVTAQDGRLRIICNTATLEVGPDGVRLRSEAGERIDCAALHGTIGPTTVEAGNGKLVIRKAGRQCVVSARGDQVHVQSKDPVTGQSELRGRRIVIELAAHRLEFSSGRLPPATKRANGNMDKRSARAGEALPFRVYDVRNLNRSAPARCTAACLAWAVPAGDVFVATERLPTPSCRAACPAGPWLPPPL